MPGPTRNVGRCSARRGISSLASFVREHDRDRYQAALFAPPAGREALFALYAFNYEVARVRETVTQPMLGEIRLQWWREAVDAAFADAPPRQHFVADPLAAVIRDFAPSRAYFDRIIDTRQFDLADEPPADLAALDEYAEGTAAALLYLGLEVLGAAAEAGVHQAARDVGIAYALAGLIRAMPFHARAGRCYIPNDTAARARLDAADYAGLRGSPGVRAATREIAGAAEQRLRAARRSPAIAARAARPVLLGAVVASRFLDRLRRAGFNPFAPELARPDALQSWRLCAAALRGRY